MCMKLKVHFAIISSVYNVYDYSENCDEDNSIKNLLALFITIKLLDEKS